jgi:hypothetical protein
MLWHCSIYCLRVDMNKLQETRVQCSVTRVKPGSDLRVRHLHTRLLRKELRNHRHAGI